MPPILSVSSRVLRGPSPPPRPSGSTSPRRRCRRAIHQESKLFSGLSHFVDRFRPSTPREVSHVQRLPFLTCRPCYPGGACRCTCRAPCRHVLLSPTVQRLSHHRLHYGATPGFTRVTARLIAAADCRPRHSGPASAGPLTGSRRGPGFLLARLLFRVGSFHP